MARQRSRKTSEGRKAAPEQAPPKFQAEPEAESDNESVDAMEQDEDEEALNRLVLGDDADFMTQLERDIGGGDGADFGEEADEMDVVDEEEEDNLENVDDAELFFLDAGPSAVDANALIPHQGPDDEQTDGDAPAWEDSDDDRLVISLAGNPRLRKLRVTEAEDTISGREYAKRLRRQFQRLNPVPEWASASEPPAKRRRRSSASSVSSEDDMDMDEESLSAQPLAQLLRSSNSLVNAAAASKRGKLRPEVISIQRTRDIPMVQPSSIDSLQFHPVHPVLLSSGPASTLYLHHISADSLPTPHPLLTSVHIKHTPLHTSAFLGPVGDKIFFSGRRRYFHTWDLETGTIAKVTRVYGQKDEQKTMERFKLSPCGRYMGLVGSSKKGGGIVNILDANTTQWIAAARIEGKNGVADFAWWRDGEGMTIAGKGGEVGEWSIQSRSFVALWHDHGAVGTSVLTLGGKTGQNQLGGDRWVVIGSSSGIVNIYDRQPWVEKGAIKIPERPEPRRVLEQLTTPTSCLEISPDGQLLVISSKWKKDALRLIHLPSCTVYRNWPTVQTPLGRVTSVAFNAGSDLLAVGSEQGKIKMWEIRP